MSNADAAATVNSDERTTVRVEDAHPENLIGSHSLATVLAMVAMRLPPLDVYQDIEANPTTEVCAREAETVAPTSATVLARGHVVARRNH